MKRRIYLDHAATTPVHPSVVDKMAPWVGGKYGNPSSLYQEGRNARQAIDESRETLAKAFGCLFGEVIFTSSGTEAANLAILGAALGNLTTRKTILFSASEHHCVLHTVPILEKLGVSVRLIPVDRVGQVSIDALTEMIDEDTLLVSVMHANNETGVYNDVKAVGDLAKKHGALFHCDAVQTFPWSHESGISIDSLSAELVCASAHKFGGPKGVGALYIKAGTNISPTIRGGGQEREMRAGTENVAGIVGIGEAIRCSVADIGAAKRKSTARKAFREQIDKEDTPAFYETTSSADYLAGHLHGRFEGISAESLLILLDRMGVSASAGSACSSGSIEPSHVLLAAGWGERVHEGVRFTFGSGTTIEDAIEGAKRTAEAVRQLVHAKS